MATISHAAYGTIASLLTTELNSITNNSWTAASAAQGADGTGGSLYGDFEFVVTYGVAPSTGAVVDLYLLPSVDGTNYVDGSSSIVPQGILYVGSFELRAVTTAQRTGLRDIPLPPGLWKAIVQNKAGQTTAASGNTLKVRPHNLSSV